MKSLPPQVVATADQSLNLSASTGVPDSIATYYGAKLEYLKSDYLDNAPNCDRCLSSPPTIVPNINPNKTPKHAMTAHDTLGYGIISTCLYHVHNYFIKLKKCQTDGAEKSTTQDKKNARQAIQPLIKKKIY